MRRERLDLYKLIKRKAHSSKDDHGAVKKDLIARKTAKEIKAALMEIRDFQVGFGGPSDAVPKTKRYHDKESIQIFFHKSPADVGVFN